MKKLLGVLAFATISLTLFAQEPGQKKDSVLPYYIMMKHGKLTEVSHGRKNFVTRDMTLDGRIRRLRDMPSAGVLRL